MTSVENEVSLFYLLDLDRTLLRTDDVRVLYEEVVISRTVLSVSEISAARRRYKSGFDLEAYTYKRLVERMNPAAATVIIEEIKNTFVQRARSIDLLEPYAQKLLDTLWKRGLSFGILTMGGQMWQQTKLEAASLEMIPHMIVSSPEKGKLIAKWRQPDGRYLLPDKLSGGKNMIAATLVFLDDKTISFQHIPQDVVGVRIISATAKEPYETDASLPQNVREVSGIKGALQVLFPD